MRRYASLLPYVFIAIAGAVVAYWQLFSVFQGFDDEGYYLLSIAGFEHGGNLYSQVYSEYGPLYYELFGAFFGLTGLEPNTDNGRFILIFLWVGTALAYGVAAELMTRNRWLGLLATLATFSILRLHVSEPMAPVGFLAFLTVLALIPFALGSRIAPRNVALLVGAAIGAISLIKINVGALFAVAILAAVLIALAPRERLRLSYATSAALLALAPIVLVWSNRDIGWVRELAALEIAAAAAVWITAVQRLRGADGTPPLALRRWLGAFFAAGIGVAVVVCAVIVALGTGPSDLLDGVVLDPSRHPQVILLQPTIPAHALMLGLVAVIAAVTAPHVRARLSGNSLVAARVVVRLLAALTIVTATTAAVSLHRLSSPIALPMLLAWLAVRAPAEFEEGPTQQLSRVVVALTAVVMVMGAYPIALSRELVVALAFVLVAAVIASDGVRLLLAAPLPARVGRRAPRIAAIALALLVGVLLADRGIIELGRDGRAAYRAQTPLDLPGARHIRLPASQAHAFQTFTKAVAGCDPLVMMPAYLSFYIWSELPPPTDQNAGAWVKLLNSERQQEIVDAIKDKPKLCVIRNEDAIQRGYSVSGYEPEHYDNRPLRRYLTTTPLSPKLELETGVGYVPLTLLVRRTR